MSTSGKILLGLGVIGLGYAVYAYTIKPKTNKKTTVGLAYRNDYISDSYKEILGI